MSASDVTISTDAGDVLVSGGRLWIAWPKGDRRADTLPLNFRRYSDGTWYVTHGELGGK